MSVACPNKKSPEWKALADNVGEINAYKVFIQEGDNLPGMEKVESYIESFNKKSGSMFFNNTKQIVTAENIIEGLKANKFKTGKPIGNPNLKSIAHMFKGNLMVTKSFVSPADNQSVTYESQNVRLLESLNDKTFNGYNVINVIPTENAHKVEINNGELSKYNQFRNAQYNINSAPVTSETEFEDTVEETQEYLVDPEKERLEAANNKLKEILRKLGISVEMSNELEELYGLGVNGVADMLNKMVSVSDMKYLPEEAAHFIIRMLPDSPYKDGLFKLARKSNLFGELYESYMEKYNQDENKVVEEIAGKLLAQGFYNTSMTENETTLRRLATIAQKLWEQVKAFFSSNPSIEQQINEVFNELAGNVYNDNVNFDTDNLGTNKFFNISAAKVMNKSKSTRVILDDAINKLQSKVAIARRTSFDKKDAFIKDRTKLIEELEEKLVNKKYISGIYSFINKIKEEMYGSDNVTGKSMNRIRLKLNKIKEDIDANKNLDDINNSLSTMYKYYTSYKPIIEAVYDNLDKETEFVDELKEELTDEQIENLKDEVFIINNQLDYLKQQYLTLAKITITKVALENSTEQNLNQELDSEGNKEGILTSLEVVLKDENNLNRMIQAMSESNDTLLRVIDNLVKNQKEKARLATIEFEADLLNLQQEYRDKGLTDFDYIAETFNGEVSGHFLDEYNRGSYLKARDEFFKKWKENPPNDAQEQRAYEKDLFYFKVKNGTYRKPSKKHLDPRYGKLTELQKNYLETLKAYKILLEEGIPSRYKNPYLLPQFRKDIIERVKGDPKNIANIIGDGFIVREDETEFGTKSLKDELDNEVKFLPIYGNNRIKNPQDNLSLDVTGGMIAYAAILNDYKQMSKIIHTLEVAKDVAKNRKVVKGKVDHKKIEEMSADEIIKEYNTIGGGESLNFKRLEDYYNMQIYGQMKKKDEFGGSFRFMGKDINIVKVIDSFGKYTALNNLAVNIFAAINNVTLGRAMTFMESISTEYYNTKQLYSADKEMLSLKMIDDVGKKVHTSKIMVWAKHMNVLQDYDSNILNINSNRNSKFSQLFTSNTFFALSHIGEFQIQMRSSIAFAKNIKLKDSKGRITNLYNAYEAKDGKLQLHDKFTVVEKNRIFDESRVGTEVTQDDIVTFIKMQHNLNQELHGIYNTLDKSAIQQYSVGRLVMMFRKFLVPAFNRRYRGKQWNEMSQSYQEGYYRTLGNFMKNLFHDMETAKVHLKGLLNKDGLSDEDQRIVQNLRRAMSEVALFVGLVILTNFILADINPDDDEWALSMFLYQSHRLYTEIGAFIPLTAPEEFFRIVESPAAAVNQLKMVTDFVYNTVNYPAWTEELSRGPYEGFTPLQKNAFNIVPFARTIKKAFHPEESIKFFTSGR